MIFCVEDDDSIRDLILYTLTASGYEARGFGETKEFWKEMRKELPQLILLDIMLPGEDGMSVLKRLREQTATAEIPVIMTTAKGAEYDKVIALDLGADDYLAKPFGMMEMVSRVRAVLRRAQPKGRQAVICTGELEMNTGEHTVSVRGERVALTLKEYELLKILMEHPGMAFSRDQLMTRVWGEEYMGETRTVDVHIASVRTKLGECGSYIKTVRGVGYRLERRL